jgi:hypothetical protein
MGDGTNYGFIVFCYLLSTSFTLNKLALCITFPCIYYVGKTREC